MSSQGEGGSDDNLTLRAEEEDFDEPLTLEEVKQRYDEFWADVARQTDEVKALAVIVVGPPRQPSKPGEPDRALTASLLCGERRLSIAAVVELLARAGETNGLKPQALVRLLAERLGGFMIEGGIPMQPPSDEPN